MWNNISKQAKTLVKINYRFSSIKNLVKNVMDNYKLDEGQRKFDNFCQNFYKVYLFEKANQEKKAKVEKSYLISSINSIQPLRDIVQTFVSNSKQGFDEQLVTMTLIYLAKTYQSFGEIPRHYADFNINQLQDSWRFVDLVGDIQYGLKKGVSFQLKSIASSLDSLYALKYKSLPIQQQALEKIIRILKNQDSGFELNMENPLSNPQIHKQHYYSETVTDTQELLQNEEFLNYLKQIQQEDTKKQKLHKQQNDLKSSNSQSKDAQEIEILINQLVSEMAKSEQNIREVAKGIIAIREQYLKLLQAQKSLKSVMENPNLNIELLELEEMLVENGLLTIDEMKNPQLLKDQQSEDQIVQILEQIIAGNNKSISGYLNQFLKSFQFSQGQQRKEQIKKKGKQGNLLNETGFANLDLANSLSSLSNLANLNIHEVNRQDYISKNWQPYLEKEEHHIIVQEQQVTGHQQTMLTCDRIFSKIFLETVQKFKEILPLIEERVASETDVRVFNQLAFAYSNVGLSKPALQFLAKVEDKANFDNFTTDEIFNLINTLNRLLKKLPFKNSKQIFDSLAATLQKKSVDFDSYQNALSLVTLIIHNKYDNESFRHILNNLVFQLQQNTNYLNLSKATASLLYDLKLFFEVSKYPTTENIRQLFTGNSLYDALNFQESTLAMRNPIKDKLVEVLQKNSQSDINLQQIDFRRFPPNYIPDYVKSALSTDQQLVKLGYFFLPTNMTQLDDPLVDGRTLFRFKLLENKLKIQCLAIPMAELIEIQQKDSSQSLQLIDQEKLRKILEEITSSKKKDALLKELAEISNNFANLLLFGQKQGKLSVRNQSTFSNILQHIERILLLNKIREKQTLETLSYSTVEEIKYLLYQISDSFAILDEHVQKAVNELCKSKFNIDTFPALLKNISGKFTSMSVSDTTQLISLIKKNSSWIGKRLTSELIMQQQQTIEPVKQDKQFVVDSATNSQVNVVNDIEFLNTNFLLDPNYHQYSSWNDMINNKLSLSNMAFVQPNHFITKVINNNKISSLIPSVSKNLRYQIKPLSYSWNWESFYLQGYDKLRVLEGIVANESNYPQLYRNEEFIVNLQNFKYEVKNTFTHKEIAEFLTNFNFINELIDQHLQNVNTNKFETSSNMLARDPEDYFTYLEQCTRNNLFNSDYFQFFIEKAKKKQKIIMLWNLRYKGALRQQFYKMKQGQVSRQDYENLRDTINQELLDSLKDFDNQNQKENVLLQGPSNKFIDVKFNFEELITDKISTNSYNRTTDKDYIICDGNLEQALKIKRFRAEQKLIKLRILKKVQNNLQLTQQEKEYIKKWLSGDLNKMKNQTPTERSIGSLSESDKKILSQLKFSNISQFKEFALNDFIMELAMFYSVYLISEVEFKMNEAYLTDQWKINCTLLKSYNRTNSSALLVQEAENLAWREGQQLSDSDYNDLEEVMLTLRDKTPADRKRLSQEKELRSQAYSAFNSLDQRLVLLEKFFQTREQEYNTRTEPEQLKEKQGQVFQKLWLELFGKKYEQTDSIELHNFINEFVQRLHILRKVQPRSFGYFVKQILIHPKLLKLDREIVISFMQIFEVDLNLDSIDILDLGKQLQQQGQKNKREIKHIKDEIRRASVNYIEPLFSKLSSIA